MTIQANLNLSIDNTTKGTLSLELYDTTVPKTVRNFLQLCTQSTPTGYCGTKFHRLIKGFMLQGGDFTKGDGTGGYSIYGTKFNDENFIHGHDERGVLSMANSGVNTNGSQFFITFRPTPHLDGKHVVFGRVKMEDEESVRLLNMVENIQVDRRRGDAPIVDITFVSGGIVSEEPKEETPIPTPVNQKNESLPNNNNDDDDDGDEIDLEEDEENNTNDAATEEKIDTEQSTDQPKTKRSALQDRLRKLKMKMNQSCH